jgi:hypothetical protein
VVGAELTGTSMTSGGQSDGTFMRDLFAPHRAESPH